MKIKSINHLVVTSVKSMNPMVSVIYKVAQ